MLLVTSLLTILFLMASACVLHFLFGSGSLLQKAIGLDCVEDEEEEDLVGKLCYDRLTHVLTYCILVLSL